MMALGKIEIDAAVVLTYDCYFKPEDIRHIKCSDV